MALVSYDYGSDSDVENDEEGEENVVIIPKLDENDGIEENSPRLFSVLPPPKSTNALDIQEENDEFLNKSSKPNDVKPKNKTKITVPSLKEYTSDDEDEPKKKIIKPSIESKSTGLFAVLPPPKVANPISTTKFVPNSLKKPPTPKPAPKSTPKPQNDIDDTDDKDDTELSHFFASIYDKVEVPSTPVVTTTVNVQNIDSARPVRDVNMKTNQYFADLVMSQQAAKQETPAEPVEEEIEEDIMKEAYSELVGRSRKAKGKKRNAKPELNIIDINETDVRPDRREWMTKSLTEEQPAAAVKKGDEPSVQSKRKHQITYLAYQAKLNEQELKNQWAMNRMSRKQTQAKYGF